MAITIQQSPRAVTPAYNDIIFVVSSTNTAQSNFQYVCDIYIENYIGPVSHAGRGYLREKVPVDPVYSSGVFNISTKIRDFLSYDIGDKVYGAERCDNSLIRVTCKFGEEYGPSSGIVVYPDLTNSSQFSVWSGVMDWREFKDYENESYVTSSPTPVSTPVLTQRPSSGTIRSDESGWVYALSNATDNLKYAVIETWKANGTFIKVTRVNNEWATVNNAGTRMIKIPAGLEQLDQIPSSGIVAPGTQPISFNTGRYRIYWENASSGQTRAEQWFIVDDEACSPFTTFRLHWLNELGGFDSFSFIMKSEESEEINRAKFKRNHIRRLDGGSYGYNRKDINNVTYRTKIKDKITINSDWIDEDTYQWLEELVSSPVIFHDHDTEGLLAINITDTNYVKRNHVNDKAIQLQVTFEYTYDRYRQTQ